MKADRAGGSKSSRSSGIYGLCEASLGYMKPSPKMTWGREEGGRKEGEREGEKEGRRKGEGK